MQDRRATGRGLRRSIPRKAHGEWKPRHDRPDPVALIEESDQSRVRSLVPIRHGRMLVSPFTFYRGTAMIMAADLARTPTTGLEVQVSGDAHLQNFGVFATPERHQVFDVRDFDETSPGPWEWDLKRLAASVVIAGRVGGVDEASCREAARQTVHCYRTEMRELAELGHLEVWYRRIETQQVLELADEQDRAWFERDVVRSEHRDHQRALRKLTTVENGSHRFLDDPPLLMRVTAESEGARLEAAYQEYRASLPAHRRVLMDRYRPVDVARKVVGVGSVGTRCWVLLLEGDQPDDPLFLQVKEAETSVIERYWRKSGFDHSGKRVVEGQRLLQAQSDIFLGWSDHAGFTYYVRQLWDMKGVIDCLSLGAGPLAWFGGWCGRSLAQGHARSGDPDAISAYLGAGEAMDVALTEFAHLYADQVERDFEALEKAARSGRVSYEPDLRPGRARDLAS